MSTSLATDALQRSGADLTRNMLMDGGPTRSATEDRPPSRFPGSPAQAHELKIRTARNALWRLHQGGSPGANFGGNRCNRQIRRTSAHLPSMAKGTGWEVWSPRGRRCRSANAWPNSAQVRSKLPSKFDQAWSNFRPTRSEPGQVQPNLGRSPSNLATLGPIWPHSVKIGQSQFKFGQIRPNCGKL